LKDKPIPKPTPKLIAQCDADNQFSNFERVFRTVMSVPKAEVLKREKKELHRKKRMRARKQKD
jgi:hypothetical protein